MDAKADIRSFQSGRWRKYIGQVLAQEWNLHPLTKRLSAAKWKLKFFDINQPVASQPKKKPSAEAGLDSGKLTDGRLFG
ncbi:hypothetical protein [Serratia proteamaculans]|uniref:hypothetical protein n=1 Tax=Serratia proteamaculans TaxID=28151 RepID=UPI000ED79AEF|nr:hypothetical protein [Serratia sp. (in: enterobacteria)]